MSAPVGIALLGATGSIGETAQRVVARHPDRFRFAAMTAHGNREALANAAARWAPAFVGLVNGGGAAGLPDGWCHVGSSRVDLQACKLEYSIVSPK